MPGGDVVQRHLALINQRGRSEGSKSFHGCQAVGANTYLSVFSEIVSHTQAVIAYISA